MKKIIGVFLYSVVLLSSVTAQDFSVMAIENPFGINIDTTGGVEVYVCDFADIDGDGDLDLIYPYMDEEIKFVYQENLGSKINPIFDPIKELKLQIDSIPGLFIPDFVDMNNDGLVDIVSFGAIDEVTGYNCTYYENKGNNIFETRPGSEIGLPGIGNALGIPEIVDLNQDGDKDIILSGALIETVTGDTDVMFYYGQNSDITDPNFVGWFIEPYSFAFMDTFQVAIIKTGDLDLDGDIDLFMSVAISDEETRFMYQENISPPFETNDFSGPQSVSPFGLGENIDGLHFLEDLDGDGDLDLFLFDDLNIVYYENTSCVNTNATMNVTLCGESSYSINDETFTSSGSYTQMLSNNAGCDSLLTIILQLNEHSDSDFEIAICEGSSYNWNGEEFMIAGEYQRTFESANGCDSIVTLVLKVSSVLTTSFEDSFCMGSEYDWNNEIYTVGGTYEQTFTTQLGCDSIVTLNLSETAIDFSIGLEENTLNVVAANSEIAWYDCQSNSAIEGENQNTYTPEETGSYAAVVSQGGCEVMSECFDIMITSTQDGVLSQVYIYPNPAERLITLHGLEKISAETKAIIFNVEGKSVVKHITDGQIDVSDMRPGYYHLSISYDSQFLRIPLIIMR